MSLRFIGLSFVTKFCSNYPRKALQWQQHPSVLFALNTKPQSRVVLWRQFLPSYCFVLLFLLAVKGKQIYGRARCKSMHSSLPIQCWWLMDCVIQLKNDINQDSLMFLECEFIWNDFHKEENLQLNFLTMANAVFAIKLHYELSWYSFWGLNS